MTNVKVKDVSISAEGKDNKTDRRTFSGTVKFSIESAIGSPEIDVAYYDVQNVDDAVHFALTELGKFAHALSQAVQRAKVEYGYTH